MGIEFVSVADPCTRVQAARWRDLSMSAIGRLSKHLLETVSGEFSAERARENLLQRAHPYLVIDGSLRA